MASRPIQIILALTTLLAGLLFTRAPLMMASEAPKSPWADGPMKLIATPLYETKKTDMYTTGASHMCMLHNCIIRGYNSIWHQAPHVADADKPDFINYSLTWHKFVQSHHDDEEANLFPKVEDQLADKQVWEESHKEHESFLDGLAEFKTYLTTLPAPTDFSGSELRRIMESFRDPFETHFHNEIKTIAEMADHPRAPAPGTPEETAAGLTFKTWGKTTVSKAGMLDVVPFFLLNLDRTVEEGLWANWPPMPAPIKWGMVNLAGSWHSGWWKFSSCDANQRPKELYARGTEPAEAKSAEPEL
ncbi:uncharacterized protein DNG_05041 [Cephalotrichum gorgonifer]|uniref:Hemerythrin-like domain-containing protein n=1 Tax=Cephalotrichum gorgonifer TaxID=2041049 RepID=A0AAE8SV48_9PEZI|nr:uncharacterized protein DNG_05041 [Cephalotrichum gorgonifer]